MIGGYQRDSWEQEGAEEVRECRGEVGSEGGQGVDDEDGFFIILEF